MNISQLPCRVTQNITIQQVGDETLIYDELRHRAFCLNKITGLIWKFANGARSTAQIADAAASELTHPVTEEIVRFALGELQRDVLLEANHAAGDIAAMQAVSRRELVKRLGVGAALMMPVVTAVFAPPAAHAASGGGGGGCLLPNTLIQLPDGLEIQARFVRPNQWVRGIDPATGKVHNARVTKFQGFRAEQLLTFFTESGESVQSSPAHPFIADAGNVSGTLASEFRSGDSIMVYNHQERRAVPSKITAIQTSNIPQKVVIFSLDTPQHCFVSGGVVSHNLTDDGSRSGSGSSPDLIVKAVAKPGINQWKAPKVPGLGTPRIPGLDQ